LRIFENPADHGALETNTVNFTRPSGVIIEAFSKGPQINVKNGWFDIVVVLAGDYGFFGGVHTTHR